MKREEHIHRCGGHRPPLWFMGAALGLLLILGTAVPRAEAQATGAFVRTEGTAENVTAPNVIAVSNAVVQVFTNNPSRTSGRTLIRTIQNTGTVPVYYAINTNAVTTNSFHGIIAGGLAAGDGLGSIVNLNGVPFPVYVFAPSGTAKISVIDMTQ